MKNLLFYEFNGKKFAVCWKSSIFADEIKTKRRYDKLYIRMVVALLKIETVVSYEAV